MSVGTLDVEIWTSEERFEPKIEICEWTVVLTAMEMKFSRENRERRKVTGAPIRSGQEKETKEHAAQSPGESVSGLPRAKSSLLKVAKR